MNPLLSKREIYSFTVEQSHAIGMAFCAALWPCMAPQSGKKGAISEVFIAMCRRNASCAEWNEAVRQVTTIPKEGQRAIHLFLPLIFQCAIEFCKVHNQRCEGALTEGVNLLESMRDFPSKHELEWEIWEKAIECVQKNQLDGSHFDWNKEPIAFYKGALKE